MSESKGFYDLLKLFPDNKEQVEDQYTFSQKKQALLENAINHSFSSIFKNISSGSVESLRDDVLKLMSSHQPNIWHQFAGAGPKQINNCAARNHSIISAAIINLDYNDQASVDKFKIIADFYISAYMMADPNDSSFRVNRYNSTYDYVSMAFNELAFTGDVEKIEFIQKLFIDKLSKKSFDDLFANDASNNLLSILKKAPVDKAFLSLSYYICDSLSSACSYILGIDDNNNYASEEILRNIPSRVVEQARVLKIDITKERKNNDQDFFQFKKHPEIFIFDYIKNNNTEKLDLISSSPLSIKMYFNSNIAKVNISDWTTDFVGNLNKWLSRMPKDSRVEVEKFILNSLGGLSNSEPYYIRNGGAIVGPYIQNKSYFLPERRSRDFEAKPAALNTYDFSNSLKKLLIPESGKNFGFFNDFTLFINHPVTNIEDFILFKNNSICEKFAFSKEALPVLLDSWSRVHMAPPRFLSSLPPNRIKDFMLNNKELISGWRDAYGATMLHYALATLSMHNNVKNISKEIVLEFQDLVSVVNKNDITPLDLVEDRAFANSLIKVILKNQATTKTAIDTAKKNKGSSPRRMM